MGPVSGNPDDGARLGTAFLTEEAFAQGVDDLVERDGALKVIVDRWGPPPFWTRPPGLETLILIILEQQVSLASGRAAFERLEAAVSPLTPKNLASTDPATLCKAGLTRQKSSYCIGLGQAIVEGRIDLDDVAQMTDDEANAALVALKGVGRWTADIYRLMALRRPDIWPAGDLALVTAFRTFCDEGTDSGAAEIEGSAERWQPWRSVAARILWHGYLASRRKSWSA